MLNFTYLDDVSGDSSADDFATLDPQDFLRETVATSDDYSLDFTYSMARNNSSYGLDRVSIYRTLLLFILHALLDGYVCSDWEKP